VMLSYNALRFTDPPEYLGDLAVSVGSYNTAYSEVQKVSGGADNVAALACLQSGSLKKYKSFHQQIEEKWAKVEQDYWAKVVHGAYTSEQEHFKTNHTIQGQPAAGFGGAHAAIEAIKKGGSVPDEPTKEQMEAEAKELAAKWATGMKDTCNDMGHTIPEMEGENTAEDEAHSGWRIIDGVALHHAYDKASEDAIGYSPSEKIGTLDDCIKICAEHEDCVGTSFRKSGEDHVHYHKCFFVTKDGGNAVSSEAFVSAMKPDKDELAEPKSSNSTDVAPEAQLLQMITTQTNDLTMDMNIMDYLN